MRVRLCVCVCVHVCDRALDFIGCVIVKPRVVSHGVEDGTFVVFARELQENEKGGE